MSAKLLILLAATLLLSNTSFGQTQIKRNCGTMEHLDKMISKDPRILKQMDDIERHTEHFVKHYDNNSRAEAIISIPVVVHVVYNTTSENVSTAQVQSQIDVLTEDFRRTNADKSNTPSAFSSLAADTKIEFCLATTDPNGNATSGITRTYTSKSYFTQNDDVKFDSKGGKDAWNTSKYLNLWVCDLGSSLLGYAQFPGSGSAATDGVVNHYKYFGRDGSAQYPFNKGRTATHEVGHWLNLRHIWGDSYCGNDYVSDTPTQQYESSGCPSYPRSTCSSSDMFMNYMDYTDDRCMNMLSSGQKTRMRAQFGSGGCRQGLLTSNGCGGGTTTPSYCASKGNDASYEWVANVTVGSINNSTGNNGGYVDLTSISTDLEKGKSYSVSLSPGFSGSTYNEYWKIWIDYNQDMDFGDAGELVYDAGSMSSSTVTGSFTVSTGATNGQTRMRVTMKYNAAPTECETFSYGEVEDYTVNIIDAPATCDIPSGLSASSITDNSATLSWSSTGADSYDVRLRKSGTSTWSTSNTTGTSINATGLSASTTYEFQTRSLCGTLTSSYSSSYSFSTADPPCDVPGSLTSSSITESSATASWGSTGASNYDVRYRQSGTSTWATTSTTTTSKGLSGLSSSTAYEWQVRGVCSSTNISSYSAQASFTTSDPPVASYCSSKGNDASYEWIAGVAVGSINNSTGNNGGYADFTSISTDLEKGASTSFTLTPGFSGSTYSEYWK
ncbi:MAG: fibronectin type III domain-containing protein, partial [Bacteroidia bacterium]|nr:fibronectin type III domain-containing protein [Bacteroidia bacterium]